MATTNIPETRLNSWYERLHSGEWKTIAGRIARYLYDANCGKTCTELSEALNIKEPSLTQPLLQLYKDNVVIRTRKENPTTGRVCISHNLHPLLLRGKKPKFSSN